MIAPLFPSRPTGRDTYPTRARFCSLLSKPPPVESGGVRQIRHTPRYWVALDLGNESAVNQHVDAAYAALCRRWRLHTVRCISRMRPAYGPRQALESRNSPIPVPSRKGGR